MSELHFQVCLVYLDDIIIFSETPEQNFERFVIALERLRSTGLKQKPQKCALFQKSISFLGYVVSEKGIGTDPTKTEVVRKWPVPKLVHEVRSSWALQANYRCLVSNFASIAGPLHAIVGNICPTGNRGHRSEWRGQIFDLKLLNCRFCACAVKICPKLAYGVIKSPQFEAIYKKSWSLNIMVRAVFRPEADLTLLRHRHTKDIAKT